MSSGSRARGSPSRSGQMPDFSHLEDNAAEAELAWIETRPWNN